MVEIFTCFLGLGQLLPLWYVQFVKNLYNIIWNSSISYDKLVTFFSELIPACPKCDRFKSDTASKAPRNAQPHFQGWRTRPQVFTKKWSDMDQHLNMSEVCTGCDITNDMGDLLFLVFHPPERSPISGLPSSCPGLSAVTAPPQIDLSSSQLWALAVKVPLAWGSQSFWHSSYQKIPTNVNKSLFQKILYILNWTVHTQTFYTLHLVVPCTAKS